MKRFWHYLKPNEKSETINRCIFFDTETKEVPDGKGRNKHVLVFGWACSVIRNSRGVWGKPKWKRFSDVDDFWLWVMCRLGSRNRTWMWCHNSSFDYPVVDAFRKLPKLGFELYSLIIDAPPTVVKYTSGTKSLVLCDTLNLWRMGLEKMGKLTGLEKLKMPEKWTGSKDDDAYCKRDVEIICKAVCDWSDFLRDNDFGGFCPTIASQSMRTFRHRFMHDQILIEANDLTLGLARSCYHGGRCEAGYIGSVKGPVYSVDVNSMYPYVMATCDMPVRLNSISRYVHPSSLRRLLQKYCVCAHVRLCTNIPAFPFRADGKLTFPVGRFDAHLCTPEIEYALEKGALEEVYLCATYDKAPALRNFAVTLYEYKKSAAVSGDKVRKEHFKLLLNSFYGKFGQSGRHWVEVGTCDPDRFCVMPEIDAQSLKVTYRRYFGGILSERAQDPESMESHPAIAAHVTSHARMVLWTLIEKLPPSNYLYCDTDGLLILKEGFDTLRDFMHDTELGGLSHVATYSDVTVYGCKDLLLDGKRTLKGIRNDAQRLDEGKYRQVKWYGLAGLLAADSIDAPLTVDITKTLSRTYNKGIIGPDGFVTPHVYSSFAGRPPAPKWSKGS